MFGHEVHIEHFNRGESDYFTMLGFVISIMIRCRAVDLQQRLCAACTACKEPEFFDVEMYGGYQFNPRIKHTESRLLRVTQSVGHYLTNCVRTSKS